MGLIDIAIDRLLETDPAAWLGYKLTEPQDLRTVGEAMDMIKTKAKMAIDSATRQTQDENKRLRAALEEIVTRPRKRHPMAIATEALTPKEATDADKENS